MKELTLSNGWKITAYVGDGFDGSSGVYFKPPSGSGHNSNPQNVTVPKKDALKVAKLLHWYAMRELALRLYEGTIFNTFGDSTGREVEIGNCSSPYQALFFAGGCLKVAKQASKAKRFPVRF